MEGHCRDVTKTFHLPPNLTAAYPYISEFWEPAKFNQPAGSHHSSSYSNNIENVAATKLSSPLLLPSSVHNGDWSVDSTFSPIRVHHVTYKTTGGDTFKPVDSCTTVAEYDGRSRAPAQPVDGVVRGNSNNSNSNSESQSSVRSDSASQVADAAGKAPAKKQTHQAIREALSKKGIALTLDRPWESVVRRHSVEGVSSSQSSPSSTSGSPPDNSQKSVDLSAECHKKRPQMSYMQLIQMALNSVPDKRMNLQQIYSWIEEHYPFFKLYARKGWKNSVRHNLSLYDIFVREKPDPNDEWKFSYWCLRPENAVNGVPNSASKRDAEGKKPKSGRASVYATSDYVVAVPPSMQTTGTRPLLPRSTPDTVAMLPLDYMYQLPASQTGNFVCAAATPLSKPNYTGTSLDSSLCPSSQSDSGYISLNGSVLPVFPGQSFIAGPDVSCKLPVTVPKPRNVVREVAKRPSDQQHHSPRQQRKSRKSLPAQPDKPVRKYKKRTKSTPVELEIKENVFCTPEDSNALENNFSSPLRMLLQSPPQGNFTSTPYKDKPLSTLRVTPIKSATKGQGQNTTSPKMISLDCAFFSPGGKKDGNMDVSILSNRSFNLSIPGLTPLKDKEPGVHAGSESGNLSMNDSLGKLLSDFQYDDHLLDCGVLPIDMDMVNGSFLTGIGSVHGSPAGGGGGGLLGSPLLGKAPSPTSQTNVGPTLQQL